MSISEHITIITSVVSALSTVVLAIITWRYERSTKKILETSSEQKNAEIIIALRNDFSSPEMLSAINTLRHWKIAYPNNFASQFKYTTAYDSEEFRRVDQARHMFKGYVFKILILLERNIVEEDLVRALLPDSAAAIFIDIVKPMEESRDNRFNERHFDKISNMYKDELPSA